LGKKAWQSSNYSQNASAFLAVDGIRGPGYSLTSCEKQGGYDDFINWWAVDLGGVAWIYQIDFYSHPGICRFRPSRSRA